ncbi:MAG: radical SAM protein, partial [Deltaproteobacteria bacterium]|nr:radical SAM protein [Deltaproteobacteria bacterium]
MIEFPTAMESAHKITKGNGRPAFLNKYQPKTTYTGATIREVPWTLPYWTQSLCPECRKVIKARKFIEGSHVYMEKKCVEHGTFKELISPDAGFYMRLFTTRYGDGRGYFNPIITTAKVCPEDCGICNMHHSHTCMANIDLTSRCDMTCPICYADANCGAVIEPSYEQVVEMMKILRNRKPVPVKVVQFSGGEPTCHPRFLDIVRKAKDLGFSQIQIAHNGKNMSDTDFAHAAAEAGLHTLYLQFDGLTKDVYLNMRAEDVLEIKLKTVEACRETGLKIVLVPTVIKGINDDQVGEIVKFACENADVVTGVSFQPVCFTGRISEKDRLNKRYTITHLAKDIAAQTDNLMPLENWFPLSATEPFSRLSEAVTGKPSFMVSCHPDCGAGGYLFVEPKNKKEIKPLTSFFNLESALAEIQILAEKISERKNSWWNKQARRLGFAKTSAYWQGLRALKVIRKYFNSSKAPAGLTFQRLLGVVDGYRDTKRGRESNATKTKSYNTVFVAAMHFQDVYNYDIERVKRCIIHHAAPD